MASGSRLKAERVELRPPSAADRSDFLAAVRESRELHRPWVYPPSTPSAYDGWLREGEDGRRERWLVRMRESGLFAGYLAANEIVYGSFQSAYLGYWATAPCAGRGLMREALVAALDHWFHRRRFRLHRLEANIQPRNEASRGLIRRLGFRLEGLSPRYLAVGGVWRDHERWALTAEEWRGGVRPGP